MLILKLAIITELFHPHVGGQEIRYFDFCKELMEQGHEVKIFTVRYNQRLPSTENFGQIKIHRYAFSPRYVRGISRDIASVLNYSIQTGVRIPKVSSFDAVIFNQWPLFPVLFSEPLCRTTTIVDWCEPWPTGLINAFQKMISHLPDGHTTVSDHIRLWLMRNYNIQSDKIESIPSAVRTSLYKSHIEDKDFGKVVFVGRLAKHKRLDVLAKAIKIARKKCPEITLDIIGPGSIHGIQNGEINSSKSFIKIHGLLPDDEKIRHLKKAWVLAVLSEREGFPRVVAEALAAGTPIITSDFPENGTRNIVRKTNAGIVCTPSPQDVAETLIKLYNNANLWKKLSHNAVKSASQYELSKVTRKLIAFIQNLSGVN